MDAIFDYLSQLNWASVIVRILLAVLAGGIIGYERGKHGRAAGLRTHILVSVGAAMSAMLGEYMVTSIGVGGDPSRIASGVVSGIGFLCAGIILVKNSSKVTGLTTAAAMWATATVGLAFGAGFYLGGLLATIILFATLTIMTIFETRQKKDRRFYVEIDDATYANAVMNDIKKIFTLAHNFDVLPSKSGIPGHVGVSVNIDAPDDSEVIETLRKITGVVFAFEE